MPGLSPYRHEPLRLEDGIPVFSERDAYIANYEQIARDHLAHLAATGQNPWIPEDLWQELEAMTSRQLGLFVPAGSRVLDAGVGLGRMLSQHDFISYGIDISLDYLRVARAKGITVAFARIEDMPYRPEFFDAVVCTDVLEHVIDLHLCLTRIIEVIRPGGYLVVRAPSREDMSQYLVELPYRFIHLRLLDAPMLQIHLDRVFGLETVDAVTGSVDFALVARKP